MRLRRFEPNKAHLRVATLAILIVMCTVLILSAVFPFPEGTWGFLSIGTSQRTSANPDWLSGWDLRCNVTIDADDIDSDLAWFPACVKLGTSVGINNEDVSFIFDEIGSNYKKIAITPYGNTTQLYVEVEAWNSTAETGVLWVSRDGWVIDDTLDITLSFYYDAGHADNTDYVADLGGRPEVWNANYTAVWHMPDPSVHWTTDTGNPIIGGAEPVRRGEEVIIKDGSTFHLYYTECPRGTYQYFHATSSAINGSFTGEESILTSTNSHGGLGILLDPTDHTAIKLSEDDLGIGSNTTDVYWMFYNDGTNIDIATNPSLNGTWTKRTEWDPALAPGAGGQWDDYKVGWDAISVFQTDDSPLEFAMLYSGEDGTYREGGLATSSNLTDWTKSGSNPVLPRGGAGTWEGTSVEPQDVWKTGSTYILVYTGYQLTIHPSEALGIATATNLTNWTKRASNPIFDTPDSANNGWSGCSDFAIYRDTSVDYIFYEGGGSSTYGIGRAWCDDILTATQGSMVDSTSNKNYGAKKDDGEPSQTDGQIGYAQDFDGANDYISVTPAAGTAHTIEAWIYPETESGADQMLFERSAYDIFEYRNKKLGSYTYQSDQVYSNTEFTKDDWYNVALSRDGTSYAFYLQGAPDGTPTGGSRPIAGTHGIGGRVGGTYPFDGVIDEFRLSNVARSAAWIKATYETGRDDLLDWGSEEGISPEITNTPGSNDFGILEVNTTSNTAINYFTIENTGNCNVDVVIYGTDVTGGDDTWTLSDTATPGENIYGLYAGLDDDDDLFDVIVKKTATYNTLVSNLAEDATQDWGLKIYMPTSLSGYDAQQMTGTVTLVATVAS